MVDKQLNNDKKLVINQEYKFCPWCAARLIEKHIDGKTRKACHECDFIYYRNPVPAAGGFIVEDGKVLLVKRKYPPRKGCWSFPSGFMEYGETPANCCIREVKEETGLDVEAMSSFKVYSGHDDPRTKSVLIMYIVKVIGGKPMPGDDASELRFFAMNDLPENIAFESHIRAIDEYKNYQRTGKLPDPNE